MQSTEKNISRDLLHCPFCGGKASLYEDYTGYWLVQCDSCGISTLKTKSRKSAILNWNRRKA